MKPYCFGRNSLALSLRFVLEVGRKIHFFFYFLRVSRTVQVNFDQSNMVSCSGAHKLSIDVHLLRTEHLAGTLGKPGRSFVYNFLNSVPQYMISIRPTTFCHPLYHMECSASEIGIPEPRCSIIYLVSNLRVHKFLHDAILLRVHA